jgi:ketosteroid isomerase-like protein
VSPENVELIQRSFVVWGETGAPDWGVLHAEVEAHDHDIMDAGEYRGRAGVERWLADWAFAWSEFSMDPEEFIDAGDRVVAVIRMTAKRRSSGVVVERQDAMSTSCTTGRSCVSTTTTIANRPSKPWGLRGRRCRRLTNVEIAKRRWTPSTGATLMCSTSFTPRTSSGSLRPRVSTARAFEVVRGNPTGASGPTSSSKKSVSVGVTPLAPSWQREPLYRSSRPDASGLSHTSEVRSVLPWADHAGLSVPSSSLTARGGLRWPALPGMSCRFTM